LLEHGLWPCPVVESTTPMRACDTHRLAAGATAALPIHLFHSSRCLDPEQPPGGRASARSGAEGRVADCRREASGRPARPFEGGPTGPTETDKRGVAVVGPGVDPEVNRP
jgi:hypothetical protein